MSGQQQLRETDFTEFFEEYLNVSLQNPVWRLQSPLIFMDYRGSDAYCAD